MDIEETAIKSEEKVTIKILDIYNLESYQTVVKNNNSPLAEVLDAKLRIPLQ